MTATFEDLPDVAWDVSQETFSKDFHDRFHSDLESYGKYLKTSFGDFFRSNEISGRLMERDNKCDIDRVAVHYRTRRVREDEPAAWQRLLYSHVGVGEMRCLEPDQENYYNDRLLPQHAFRRAKKRRMLGIEFTERDEPDFFCGDDLTSLRVPRPVCEIMTNYVDEYRRTLDEAKVADRILKSLKKNHEAFVGALARYCSDANMEEAIRDDQARMMFLMASSLITLTLLKRGRVQLPRCFFMVPVFVGSETVGGMAFFSDRLDKIRSKGPPLKGLARGLLSYIALLEGRETEYDKRRLEASSPVIHLFLHSVTKAFTTPILNICDELDQTAAAFREDAAGARRRERLSAITTFLRCFSRRWGGTFGGLINAPRNEATSPRFLEIDEFDGRSIKGELEAHVKALFAVQMANDVFDVSEFKAYRPYLETLDGVQKLVDLRFDLDHSIPAQKDVLLLHLLSLVQNSLEALSLGEALWNFRKSPRLLKGTVRWVTIISRETAEGGECGPTLVIEVKDNGQGFTDPKKLERLTKYLGEFSDCGRPPPTLGELRQRIDKDPEDGGVSTKSGGALGLGILSIADYVSRICRVRWPVQNGEPLYPDHRASIVQRGAIAVANAANEHGGGSSVQIRLPGKRPTLAGEGVFLERRD